MFLILAKFNPKPVKTALLQCQCIGPQAFKIKILIRDKFVSQAKLELGFSAINAASMFFFKNIANR